jgi:hypothetical protein
MVEGTATTTLAHVFQLLRVLYLWETVVNTAWV